MTRNFSLIFYDNGVMKIPAAGKTQEKIHIDTIEVYSNKSDDKKIA